METHFSRSRLAFGAVSLVMVILARVVSAQPCVEPTRGLVAWWPGDCSADDLIGTNHGVLQGGATFRDGLVGRAFAFGAPTSSVRIAASPSLDVGAGNGMTIELWINPDDVNRRAPLVEWNNGVDLWGAHLWILPNQDGQGLQPPSSAQAGPGQLYVCFTLLGQWVQMATDANVLVPRVFQHIALTYDKETGEGRMYRNGEPVAIQNLGQFTPETAYDLFLGLRPAGPPGNPVEAYQGLMDEVSIYNRALSQTELFAIYKAGAAGKCRPESLRMGIRTSQVEIFWNSQPDVTYQVQYRSALTTNQWIPLLHSIRATNSTTSYFDSVRPGEPRRFYRVVRKDCLVE
jgi:hypothetical protein